MKSYDRICSCHFADSEGDGRGKLDPCDLDRPTAQQPCGTSDQPGGPQQPPGPRTDTRPCRRVGLRDIGNIINALMTPEETEKATGALEDSEKYDYLTGHCTPTHEYKFPQMLMNKCNRAFQHVWLTK